MSLSKAVRHFLRPTGRRLRVLLYRARGVRIGAGSRIQKPYTLLFPEFLSIGIDSIIHSHAHITALKAFSGLQYTPQITIGNGVYIGRYSYFVAIDSIRIEDCCVLSDHVYITDNAHGLHPERGPIMKQPLESKGAVHIGRNCFVGFRACIMPGVSLGEHCVVGANSVVTRSFPARSMVAGCPARLVKVFCQETGEWVRVDLKGSRV
jgi:acetyltransferase-like isoleucine patch superfamily enzyme